MSEWLSGPRAVFEEDDKVHLLVASYIEVPLVENQPVDA